MEQMTFPEEMLPPPDTLRQIKLLGQFLTVLRDEVKAFDTALKEAKERYRDIEQNQLPLLMETVGLTGITLDDGTRIDLKTFYEATLNDTNRFGVIEWLEQHNCEAIIKNTVTARFEKGQDDIARQTMIALAEKGIFAENKRDIHPQTLKAFVKEQCESNPVFPRDLFKVFEGKKVAFR